MDRSVILSQLLFGAVLIVVLFTLQLFSPGMVSKPLMLAAPSWAGADTDILFVMVEFTDQACTFTPAQMETNMFGGGASGPGDLDDYFDEISYGDLQLVGDVVGDDGGTTACVPLANNRAFYNNDGANP